VPAAVAALERAELVEAAGVPVDQQCVMVAPALDMGVPRDRVADAVALVGVLERDAGAGGRAANDVEREADRRALPEARAEVGVQAGAGADRRDDRGGALRHPEPVDALVPGVGCREDRTARRGGQPERVRRGARAAERGGDGNEGGRVDLHAEAIGLELSLLDTSGQVPEDLLPAMSLMWKSARVCHGTVPNA